MSARARLVRFRLGLLFHQAFAIALDLFPVRLVFRGNDRVCAGARVAVFQERVIALRAKRGLWPEPTVVGSRARILPASSATLTVGATFSAKSMSKDKKVDGWSKVRVIVVSPGPCSALPIAPYVHRSSVNLA